MQPAVRPRRVAATGIACAMLLAAASTPAGAQDGRPWVVGPFGPPRLGLDVRDPTPAEQGSGVRVESVVPGSPAETAGFKAGDAIERLAGEEIRSARQFTRLVWELLPGRAVTATVRRDGVTTDLTVTPAERTGPGISQRTRERLDSLADRWARSFRDPRELGRRTGRFGLGLSTLELTPQLARHFGVEDGVLVSTVLDDSPSARAGLRAGDVITAIDAQSVRSRADVMRELAAAPGNGAVTVDIVRDRKRSTLKLTLPAEKR